MNQPTQKISTLLEQTKKQVRISETPKEPVKALFSRYDKEAKIGEAPANLEIIKQEVS